MHPASSVLILVLLAAPLAGLDAAPPLDGRAYAIVVAGGGGAAAGRATLVFAAGQSRLDYADDASLPFTYEAHADAEVVSFTGRFAAAGTTLRGSVVGEAIKGEVIAGDDARPFSGALTREAAGLLERARERQLQRRPQEAIGLYAELIEHHRGELAWSAPALVYLVECFQALAGDAAAEARWKELSTRYLSAPPPLDGVSTITIDQAKQDLLLKSWAQPTAADAAVAKPADEVDKPAAPATRGTRLRIDGNGIIVEDDGDGKAAKPVETIRRDRVDGPWSWWIGVIAYGGSTLRLDEALIRKRDEAPLDIDGWLALRRMSRPRVGNVGLLRAQTLTLHLGTDDLAEDAGAALVYGSYFDAASRGELGVYAFNAAYGWSDERGGVTDLDLRFGFAHVSANEDDFGWSYRIGGTLMGAVVEDLADSSVRGTIGVDRIIDYKTGERRLATELYARLHVPLSDEILLYLQGAYCRDARHPDGEDQSSYQGAIGIGWNLARDF
jgi:hypothetical protein